MAAKLKHAVETTFLNSWAEAGVYDLKVNKPVWEQMRRLGMDLLDVIYVLRTGVVVESDMIGSKGLWTVRGKTVEEKGIEVRIAVVSTEYNVELLRITLVGRR